MDCRVVPIVLTRYARSSSAATGVSAEDIAEAWAHVSQCRACQEKLASLEKALLSLDEDEIPCAECRERLPEYLGEEGIDREQDPYLRSVTKHLVKCSRCAAEYKDLLAVIGQVQVAAAATQRASGKRGAREWTPAAWLPLTENLVRLSQPLFLLSKTRPLPYTGMQLKMAQSRALSPAFALKDGEAAKTAGEPTVPLSFPAGINLKGEISHSESEGFLTITVAVEYADSSHPAVGVQIGLYYEDGMPRETRLIEEDAPSATFSRIRPGENYHLRIGHGSARWEYPLDLSVRDS